MTATIDETRKTVRYADEEVVTRYIFRHYPFLFTETETLAWLSVVAETRAAAYGPPTSDFMRKAYVSQKPDVLRLLADGTEAFRVRVRNRIIAEHADKVRLNRCPKCDALARTPEACLCPACNHTWFEVRVTGRK